VVLGVLNARLFLADAIAWLIRIKLYRIHLVLPFL
jgi:hypothetical protein